MIIFSETEHKDKNVFPCIFHSSSERTGNQEKIEQFLSQHKLLERLHGLEMSSEMSQRFLSKSSKQIVEFSDANYLQSPKSAMTLELLHNILNDKYLNGISIEFRESGVSSNVLQTSSVYDNVALATQFATESQGSKR